MAMKVVLRRYGITKGSLEIDDTDNKRSKSTKAIAWVHKIKDKASGGYIMGQSLVFLVLVTPTITIPVGFAFYMPDPELTAWNKKNKQLKKAGVPAANRPQKPAPKAEYPTKQELAIQLLKEFQQFHPDIKITCINADALYGSKKFFAVASTVYKSTQIISQLRETQNVRFRNKTMRVETYFSKHPGTPQEITIRGGKKVFAIVGSARLYVCSHGQKRFVIALKYEGEAEYRYLVASDMSWRTVDVVEAYTLRWIVEVFFKDWKTNEGWATMTKLTGNDGSRHGLILSLLVDHCLLLHPDQLARIENKLPACTVGSLRSQISMESLFIFIQELIASEEPAKELEQLIKRLKETVMSLAPSQKHMVSRELGRLGPTPSLKYRAAA
jgi:hypothetical protein